MIDLDDAIRALSPSTQYRMVGEPINETEFNASFAVVTGVDEENSAILSTDPQNFPFTWLQLKAKYDELVAAEPLKLLRKERDARIAETDWWANSDTPDMTSDQTAYRQALRDITNSYQSLDDVVWPTKP